MLASVTKNNRNNYLIKIEITKINTVLTVLHAAVTISHLILAEALKGR